MLSAFRSAGTCGQACLRTRAYHLSACLANKKWRKERGLPVNHNAYGPLTDGPDYSFIDGRPTPIGSGKIKRMEKQVELSKKIMELSQETDFALDFHNKRVQGEKARKENIISRKLKPKGQIEPPY